MSENIATMTVEEFHAALKDQGVPRDHIAFKCPMCGTVQSATDLIKAGAGKTFADVAGYLGFSCVGRFTNAGAPRKSPDGKPCNWTLGGLFQMHKLEVIDEDGKHIPHFAPASRDEAQLHMLDGCEA